MFRALLKLLILVIVLVAVGGFLLGWWGSGRKLLPDNASVEAQRAREVAVKVGGAREDALVAATVFVELRGEPGGAGRERADGLAGGPRLPPLVHLPKAPAWGASYSLLE